MASCDRIRNMLVVFANYIRRLTLGKLQTGKRAWGFEV